jgi:hypothetical protein
MFEMLIMTAILLVGIAIVIIKLGNINKRLLHIEEALINPKTISAEEIAKIKVNLLGL